MKHFLPGFLLLISSFCSAQKYTLIDKTMAQPLFHANNVTAEHTYKNFFAVERNTLKQFIAEVEKIALILSDKKKPKPQSLETFVGKTRFVGLKVPSGAEERFDVVLTTDIGGAKVYMHLSDSKISNSRNAFFINTWLKYIKSYVK